MSWYAYTIVLVCPAYAKDDANDGRGQDRSKGDDLCIAQSVKACVRGRGHVAVKIIEKNHENGSCDGAYE